MLQLGLLENSVLNQQSKSSSRFPQRFGEYELLAEIGRGGMGIVYEARQNKLARTVALKMLRGGETASVREIERFTVEAEAAARLSHRHIVELYESGELEGRHYLTMRLVQGGTLQDHLHNLDQRTTAELMAKVVRAVHYAHQRGVLHRDLKPSNILLDKDKEPYVADFGLAKWLDQRLSLTHSLDILGTLHYTAPEQLRDGSSSTTISADIYSLGAILYHMIAGQPPFAGDSPAQTMRLILDHNIPDIPASRRQYNADLEKICLKCLEQEPARRYASAEALAEDLERYLRGEPVEASQSGAIIRGWKWVRRNPALSALLLLAVSAVGAVLVLQSSHTALLQVQRDEAVQERRRAELENVRASELSVTLQLQQAEHFFAQDNAAVAIAHLSRVVRDNPRNWAATERLLSALTYRNWPMPVAFFENGGPLAQVKLLSSHRLLTATMNGNVNVWNLTNGERVGSPITHTGATNLIVQSILNTTATGAQDGMVRVWNALTGHLQWEHAHNQAIAKISFSPSGRFLLTGTRGGVIRLLDVTSGRLLFPPRLIGGSIRALAFSSDEDLYATANSRSVQIWTRDSGQLRALLPGIQPREVHGLEFLPEKKLLVLRFGSLQLYDPMSGRLLQSITSPGYRAHSAGAAMAFFVEDGKGSLWNFPFSRKTATGINHSHHIQSATFSPGALCLVTTSFDRSARLWNGDIGTPLSEPLRHNVAVFHSGFGPDGLHLSTASQDGVVVAWDSRPGNALPLRLAHDPGEVWRAKFIDQGRKVLTASYDKTARVWDAANGSLILNLQHTTSVLQASITPDLRLIATASDDQWARIWDTASATILHHLPHLDRLRTLELSPDGKFVATASRDGTARLWKTATGEPATDPLQHAGMVHGVAFSPNGALLATASEDHTARIWACPTGAPASPILQHKNSVFRIQFSPDNRLLVTASNDRTARVWDVLSGKMLREFSHKDVVRGINFSPDSRRLVTASWDRTAQVWDLETGVAIGFPMEHLRMVHAAQFSPDGKRIATAGGDGVLRLWDSATGLPISEALQHGAEIPREKAAQVSMGVVAADFSPDGKRIVTASYDGYVRIWNHPAAESVAPIWLSELAEAVAGYYITPSQQLQSFERPQFLAMRENLSDMPVTNRTGEWLQWFTADRGERPIAPGSKFAAPQLVEQAISSGKTSLLWEAGLLQPANPLVFNKLATVSATFSTNSIYSTLAPIWARHSIELQCSR